MGYEILVAFTGGWFVNFVIGEFCKILNFNFNFFYDRYVHKIYKDFVLCILFNFIFKTYTYFYAVYNYFH